MTRALISAVLAVAMTTPAFAGKKEADACAAGLDGDSLKIYNRVLPKVVPGNRSANEAMFKAEVKAMVNNGEVAFFGVRTKAKAAAACVEMISS